MWNLLYDAIKQVVNVQLDVFDDDKRCTRIYTVSRVEVRNGVRGIQYKSLKFSEAAITEDPFEQIEHRVLEMANQFYLDAVDLDWENYYVTYWDAYDRVWIL